MFALICVEGINMLKAFTEKRPDVFIMSPLVLIATYVSINQFYSLSHNRNLILSNQFLAIGLVLDALGTSEGFEVKYTFVRVLVQHGLSQCDRFSIKDNALLLSSKPGIFIDLLLISLFSIS